jgi:hypothetical protein
MHPPSKQKQKHHQSKPKATITSRHPSHSTWDKPSSISCFFLFYFSFLFPPPSSHQALQV